MIAIFTKVTTDAVNECAEWEVSKLNGQDFNCSKQGKIYISVDQWCLN